MFENERDKLLEDINILQKENSSIKELKEDNTAKDKAILDQKLIIQELKEENSKILEELQNDISLNNLDKSKNNSLGNSLLGNNTTNGSILYSNGQDIDGTGDNTMLSATHNSKSDWQTIRRQKHLGQALKEIQVKLDIECQQKIQFQNDYQEQYQKNNRLETEMQTLTQTVDENNAIITQLKEELSNLRNENYNHQNQHDLDNQTICNLQEQVSQLATQLEKSSGIQNGVAVAGQNMQMQMQQQQNQQLQQTGYTSHRQSLDAHNLQNQIQQAVQNQIQNNLDNPTGSVAEANLDTCVPE